jgi:ubiquinone/menaquinone biosynthesis C-methylase UbiE
MSSSTETFQISTEQAEIYESQFVPALFAQWAPWLVDAAGVGPGQAVLDVACGTGIVARTAADRVGTTGSVTGVDLNEAMLTVARRLRPDLDWRQGDAADLPFDDNTFDVVVCQSALMFFPDATQAIREMRRVCKPGGTVGVQVFASLDAQPAYGPWVHMVAEYAGPEAINLLSTYWVHGDLDVLRKRFEAAGLDIAAIHDRTGTVRFPSVEALVLTEISATPLIDRITDETQRRILADSERVLGKFRTESGLDAPITGHLVIARKG